MSAKWGSKVPLSAVFSDTYRGNDPESISFDERLQFQGDGRLLLLPLERSREVLSAKVRIVRRKCKRLTEDVRRSITREEIGAALADFV